MDHMNIKTLVSILSVFLVLGCSNNELCVHQSDTDRGMSKPITNEINMNSYFPSPFNHIGLEDEVLLALESKFELSSGFEITILDNSRLGEIKPMYYVWFKVSTKDNSHQKGLALVIVGLNPEVFEYYKESEVIDVLEEANPSINIPNNILNALDTLLKQQPNKIMDK